MFGDNSLVGLAVEMAIPCPRCRGTRATIGAGKAMHTAGLMCACNRHLGWVSKQSYDFIAETVRLFGRPTEAIEIRAPARTAASSDADAVSQAAHPATALT